MKIEKLVVGLYEENCYFLIKDKDCIIIDPGDEADKLISFIEKNNLNVISVFITHAHFDHIGALDKILDKYNVDLYYHNVNNEIKYNKIIDIKEEKYSCKNFNFEVIYTPGHRNDSVTYYFYDDNIMFTGDFLFKESIGRMDLEYADFLEMKSSIENIKKYNPSIKILPGHGDETNLAYEFNNNFYFR